ncbi:MAG TPA: hypothetical protein VFP90_17345 [Gemmatimonadaceae bacterium]|nr:hypothetical protein [Gemmatimonadaceae bacterium]
MNFMWADTLEAAERAHLLRLVLWGGASLVVGTALVVLLRVGRQRSSLLDQFGLQNAAWGTLEVVLGGLGLRSLSVRDLAGATRLDRMVWSSIGLEVGVVLVGITLVVVGWRVARRPALIGAGLGVVVQGAALAILDLALAAQISR